MAANISCPSSVVWESNFEPRFKTNFNTTLFSANKLAWLVKACRRYFYLSNPYEEMFQHQDELIDYYTEALPLSVIFIFLEWIIVWFKYRKPPNLADGAASAAMFIFMEIGRILFRGAEHSIYIYIYTHYRVAELPWDSIYTWYLSAILIDFCYYWAHRAGHEIHFIWAHHQAHHSSENFSLVNVLRLPFFQDWVLGFAYLPLALFIPPTYYILHLQFSILYQFWIHTEIIGNLGPLEYIFNTPTHHKVHHGCNKICLDKNYGAWLIIWDRMFGTFQPLPEDQEIVYGLVDQPQSYSVMYLETFYFVKLYKKFKSMDGWKNKLYSLIKGPGWTPGSRWTGNPDNIPDIRSRKKLDQTTTWYWNIYHFTHFFLIIGGFEAVTILEEFLGRTAVTFHMLFVILSLTTMGTFFDNHSQYVFLEFARCLIALFYIQNGLSFIPLLIVNGWWANFISQTIKSIFLFSAILWGAISCVTFFKVIEKEKPL